jgi:hypothetical protein
MRGIEGKQVESEARLGGIPCIGTGYRALRAFISKSEPAGHLEFVRTAAQLLTSRWPVAGQSLVSFGGREPGDCRERPALFFCQAATQALPCRAWLRRGYGCPLYWLWC